MSDWLAWLLGLSALALVGVCALCGFLVYLAWCLIDAMFPGEHPKERRR